jgi:toxin ParE1/3/4
MRVRYSPQARAHLTAIFTYIAERNPRAAIRVLARIRSGVDQLGDFPRMGRAGLTPETYEWTVKGLPYVVVSEIHSDPNLVSILGSFHGAQDRSAQ